MALWGELKRRNVVKVAVAYAIVGWLLMEVSSVIAPALNLPDCRTASNTSANALKCAGVVDKSSSRRR